MKSKKKSKTRKTKLKKSGGKRLAVAFSTPVKRSKASDSDDGGSTHVVKKRKLYSQESMQAAYKAVKTSTISVNAAAKQFGVPLTTLRDRVDGRISMETTRPGPPLLMSKEEESEIVHFLHTMAKYGYRYTRQDLAEIATDQAVAKGKRKPNENGLTTKWVDSFVNRWPSVKELSCKAKAKVDAEHTVRTYFEEIKKIIDKYKLLEKSDRIFNIMEMSLTTDHALVNPSYKTGHQFKTENVSTTTVIACGSVSGMVMAPFLIFQASRLKPEMMTHVPCNVNASISETGKCSPQIFRRYLNEHFLPQAQRFDNEPILVLMDGSKSHMFVGMSEWGRRNNVIFSFIPAHTAHLLQPLQIECPWNLEKKYDSICKRHIKSLAGPCISRNNIGELVCQAYFKTLTRHALLYSFSKAGVFPELSSDESDDENEESYSSGMKSDDSNHEDSLEEVVFTQDLVVGQNQEVTEEELVTTTEVVLSADGQTEEIVISPEGQMIFTQTGDSILPKDGHFVIHDGNIFVSGADSGNFSHLQPMQLFPNMASDETTLDLKTDFSSSSSSKSNGSSMEPGTSCDTIPNKLLASPTFLDDRLDSGAHSSRSLLFNNDSSRSSAKSERSSSTAGSRGHSKAGGSDETQTCARTQPFDAILKKRLGSKSHRHSLFLGRGVSNF